MLTGFTDKTLWFVVYPKKLSDSTGTDPQGLGWLYYGTLYFIALLGATITFVYQPASLPMSWVVAALYIIGVLVTLPKLELVPGVLQEAAQALVTGMFWAELFWIFFTLIKGTGIF